MLVVPLVMLSVMTGVLGLGDVRKLGRPGGYTLLYYFSTTLLAVTVGLLLVNWISPGVNAFNPEDLEAAAKESGSSTTADKTPSIGAILSDLVRLLVTDNLIRSAAQGDLLPLILFSIIFAALLTTRREKLGALIRGIEQLNEAFMEMVMLLIRVAPLGIFCLVAARFGEARLQGQFVQMLGNLGLYVTTVLVGLAFHAFVTLPLLLWFFTGRNPFRFVWGMSQALLTAFSTASSSATLPLTRHCAAQAGVPQRSTDLVLPIGSTINMDGTALYEAVAVMFIAQTLGRDLSTGQQIVVALTATLAAIGAAGIPEAGLVTMIVVLNAVGLPVKYVSLILAVDWFLDRFRTAVNVWGDACGAAIVAPSFPSQNPETTSPPPLDREDDPPEPAPKPAE